MNPAKPAQRVHERRAGKCKAALLAVVGVLLLLPALMKGGESPGLTEYEVKALFLMNFTKYVEWPAGTFAETNTPIVIGVYGENKFGDALNKAVAGKVVGGRSIVIRQFDSTNDLGKCDILFISGSEKKRTPEVLGPMKSRPVLTVGETEGFLEQGGIVNFAMKDGKVRLEIDLNAARESKLQMSARLLSVADVVRGK